MWVALIGSALKFGQQNTINNANAKQAKIDNFNNYISLSRKKDNTNLVIALFVLLIIGAVAYSSFKKR